MAATNQPMIQLKDVSKIYDNGTVGLKDINLNIDKGRICSSGRFIWCR